MAAPWQTIEIAFRGGIDERTAAEYVDPSSRLLDVVNGVFTHDGAIEKRPGMQALTTTSTSYGNSYTLGAPQGLFTRGAGVLATDGDGLYSYSPGSNLWATTAGSVLAQTEGSTDRVSPCVATRQPLAAQQTLTGPMMLGIAEGAGVRAVTFTTTAGANTTTGMMLTDLATGVTVQTNAGVGGANTYNATPIILGNVLYVFYSDAGNIYWQQTNLTTQVTTFGTLVNDAANQVFDVTGYTGGNGILLCYNQTGHGGALRYLRLEALPSMAITASGYTPTFGASTAITMMCRVDVNMGVAYFAWETATLAPACNILVAAYSLPTWTQINLGGSAAAFQPTIPGYTQGGGGKARVVQIAPLSATTFWIQAIWGSSAGASPGQAVYNTGGAQLSQQSYPGCFIAGRPFLRQTAPGITRLFVPMCSYQTLANGGFEFCSLLLMDTRAYETGFAFPPYPRVVATVAPRQLSYTYYSTIMQATSAWRAPDMTGVFTNTSGMFRTVIGVQPSEEWQTSGLAGPPTLMHLASFNFSPGWSYADGDTETFFAGGAPSVYSGNGLNEIGFHRWPSGMTFVTSGAGGNMGTGTFGYAFVLAEVDAQGLIHRSPAYLASVTFGAGATNQVTWTIPSIQYTQRGTAVFEVYRTAANGSTYYFVGNVSAYGASISATVSFNDTAADAAISSNALLYTTGGVLQSVTPPSFRQMMRHVERLWGIDDTGMVVWFSTQFSPSDAPWFNEVLTLQFTDEVLTAMGSMDDKAVFWSAQHIWFVEGVGPNVLGQGSDFVQAVLLPSDVGCADWRSVCPFPGGLFFQAPSGGIYVLDRGLSVTFIGKDVQDITAGVSVVSAELVPTSNHVRFVLSTGIVLTYDYVLGRWARLQLTPGVFGTPTNAVMANNVWTAACTGGVVAQEKSTVGLPAHCYQDSTAAGVHSFVSTSVTLAHFKPGGIDGWAQLGEIQGRADWLDPADVVMTLSYDYGAASQGPATFTYANLHGAYATQPRWAMGAQAANAMATAVQVTLSDAAPTGGAITTGQGIRWLGISIEAMLLGEKNLNLATAQKQ